MTHALAGLVNDFLVVPVGQGALGALEMFVERAISGSASSPALIRSSASIFASIRSSFSLDVGEPT